MKDSDSTHLNTAINQQHIWQIWLNKIKKKTTITVIKDLVGKPHHNPKDVNNIFKNYYQDLYTLSHNPDTHDINTFLNNISLPQLTPEQTNSPEQPLTPREFYDALNKMQNEPAPMASLLNFISTSGPPFPPSFSE